MTIVVSGATGNLGRLAVQHLLARGVAASDIVAGGRNASRLAALAEETGVRTAVFDFTVPATLDAALAGAEKFVLVSSSEVGQRAAQHQNAIDAAVRAGVRQLVYTSAPKATESALILAPEHKATEEAIQASGVPATVLRNGWYHENYDDSFRQAADSGVYFASTGAGRVSSAPRTDYAEAIASVLTSEGHVGAVYELSGDTAWSGDDFAGAVAAATGREVVYRSVEPEQHHAALIEAGLDEGTAGFVVALDGNIRDGLLGETSGELERLIGHPTQPLQAYFAAVTGK